MIVQQDVTASHCYICFSSMTRHLQGEIFCRCITDTNSTLSLLYKINLNAISIFTI